MKKTTIYVCLCSIIGVVACLIDQEFLTSHSLIESLLFSSSVTYLIAKYLASSIILRNQKDGYTASKFRKILDNSLIAIFFAVTSVSLNFLYGCTALLVVKWSCPFLFGNLADYVYRLYRFNEEILEFSKRILLAILVLFTLTEYLSLKFSVKLYKFINKVTFPLKVVAILAFFVHEDYGIRDNYMVWKINREVIERKDSVTFNGSEDKKKSIEKIKELYVDIVVRQFVAERKVKNDTSNNSSNSKPFHVNIKELRALQKEAPLIKTEMDFGNVGSTGGYYRYNFTVSDKKTVDDFFSPENQTVASRNYNKDFTYISSANDVSPSKLSQIWSVLNDEQKSLSNVPLGEEEELYANCIKEYLDLGGERSGLLKSFGVFGVFKDALKDIFLETPAKGITWLFTKKSINKRDVLDAVHFGKVQVGKTIIPAIAEIEKKTHSLDYFTALYDDVGSLFTMDKQMVKTKDDLTSLIKLYTDFPHYQNKQISDELIQKFKSSDKLTDQEIRDINLDFWKDHLATLNNTEQKSVLEQFLHTVGERQVELTRLDNVRPDLSVPSELPVPSVEYPALNSSATADFINPSVDGIYHFEKSPDFGWEYKIPVKEEERGFWYFISHLEIKIE